MSNLQNLDVWRNSALEMGLAVGAPRKLRMPLFEEDDLSKAVAAVLIHLEPQLVERLDAIAKAETQRLQEMAEKSRKKAKRVTRKEVIARLLANGVEAYEKAAAAKKR